MISFSKTVYLKQLIYAKKKLIRIFLKKQLILNNLFMQNNLLGSLFKKTAYSKQLIYAKQLTRISFYKKNSLFMKNNLLGSLSQKQLIRNNLFMKNNLLGSLFCK
jgi:hypothetical protein